MLLLLLVALAGTIVPARAQYTPFGKNKVNYDRFAWRILESRHFRLYHYEGAEDLARQALELAEEGYADLRARFAHDVSRPIPLIIYSSHLDFQQTNVTPYFLPEGVAGLTEFAKGRVLVPFDGSLHAFRTTIRHELVHVFQLSIEERVGRARYRSSPIVPPAWFTEGQAVHWTEERDPEADMVLRDMVVSGNLPSIDELWRFEGSYLVYKLGQSVLDYVAEVHGEDAIRQINERLWAFSRFEDVVHDVLGLTTAELSARWAHHLKERYFPEIDRGTPAAFLSRALTRDGGSDFKPLPLPPGLPGLPHHFAFLSPRNGFTNIYAASAEGDRPETDVRTLVAGERKPEFESFHAFRSRMDVSADGLLLFVAKFEGRDQVNVFSLRERRVLERHVFPELVGISSPAWAGSARRFVFSGHSRDGFSDLYLYDRERGWLRRLTRDRYRDADPSWCGWENAVVWTSDRCPGGDEGASNLFLLSLDSGEIRYLTRGCWRDTSPVCDSLRREILFVSDRDGFGNVYRIDAEGSGRRLTRSLDALFDPRPLPDGRGFLATVYREGRFEVRRFAEGPNDAPGRKEADPAPSGNPPFVETPPPSSVRSPADGQPDRRSAEEDRVALAEADTTRPWDWRSLAAPVSSRAAAYRTDFSLDIAQGGVLVDPGVRTGEGLTAAFSDVMGDHLLFVGLGNSSLGSGDLLDNLSAAVTYVNLSRRLNYGLSLFHYAGEYYDRLGFPFFERRAGAGVVLRYPFSKYSRVETNLSLAYADTDRSLTAFRRRGPVGNHSISYVRDTALWLSTGPIDGQRLNLTTGVHLNLRRGAPESTLLFGEWSRYFRTGLLSCYALRLQGRWSDGDNPEVFLLGGSHSLRVWPYRGLDGKRSLLLNQELRLPLLRGAVLALPPGNLELPGVQGAIFADAGSAWRGGWPPPWAGAYGVGFRMGFGGFLVLRLDVGRRTDFEHWSRRTHTDFYIGWNY